MGQLYGQGCRYIAWGKKTQRNLNRVRLEIWFRAKLRWIRVHLFLSRALNARIRAIFVQLLRASRLLQTSSLGGGTIATGYASETWKPYFCLWKI